MLTLEYFLAIEFFCISACKFLELGSKHKSKLRDHDLHGNTWIPTFILYHVDK